MTVEKGLEERTLLMSGTLRCFLAQQLDLWQFDNSFPVFPTHAILFAKLVGYQLKTVANILGEMCQRNIKISI